MPFIDFGEEYTNAKEAQVVPERDYDLRTKDAELMREGGKNSIRVLIVHENSPVENPAPIFHYIGLPDKEKDAANDEAKGLDAGTTTRTKVLFAKRFMYAFGIPIDGTKLDPADIPGHSARIGLGIDEYQGMKKNVLRLPMLPSEGVEATTGKGKGKSA